MAPQRSASAPLPPFVRSSQKGVRVVRFRSAPCAHRLPCPHPSPRSQARCPPPLPVGALITLAIPSTMAIPSRVPTRPPLAPVRPCPYAGSGACSAGLLAAPRAAPGGFDYIYYTMETIIACPPPITPHHRNRLYAPLSLPSAEGSAGSAFCRCTLEGSAAGLPHYCSIKCNS